MAELTDEQVERAANFLLTGWDSISSESFRNAAKERVRAAAPFLQLPIDDPTPEEVVAANTKGSSFCMVPSDSAGVLLNRFVRNRNAAIPPKPVDPREDVVIMAMQDIGPVQLGRDLRPTAKRILAAIDEVK